MKAAYILFIFREKTLAQAETFKVEISQNMSYLFSLMIRLAIPLGQASTIFLHWASFLVFSNVVFLFGVCPQQMSKRKTWCGDLSS